MCRVDQIYKKKDKFPSLYLQVFGSISNAIIYFQDMRANNLTQFNLYVFQFSEKTSTSITPFGENSQKMGFLQFLSSYEILQKIFFLVFAGTVERQKQNTQKIVCGYLFLKISKMHWLPELEKHSYQAMILP